MKVNNTAIYMGDDVRVLARTEKSQPEGHEQRKNIDGSQLFVNTDHVTAKKELAKKRAMNLIGSAFSAERKIDEDVNARRDHVKNLMKEKEEAAKAISDLEAEREKLRIGYGVDSDSEEEQDLKLLEKEIRAKMPGEDVFISKEDAERIEELKKNGLTEYQERSLELLGNEVEFSKRIERAESEIELENSIISTIKVERLKTHAMADAKRQADAIMDEASKEAVSMLVDEAKVHMEEVSEEREEQAKAEREKQEELDKKIDAAKKRREETEELTEEILESVGDSAQLKSDMSSALQEIRDMMMKMNLIEDDIKGAAVDKNL